MKRLVVYFGENHVNIICEELSIDEHFLYAHSRGKLVGMFQIGTFDMAYLSEVRE